MPQPYAVRNTLTARMHKGINTTLDEGQTPVLAQPYTLAIRGRGDSHNLEYRQDGTANALLTPNGGRGGIGVGAIAWDEELNASVEQAGTLLRGGQGGRHDGVLAFHPTQDPINSTEVCHAIGTGNGQGCATAAVAFPIQECNVSRANLNGTGTGIGQAGDPMFTLQAAQPHGVASAMQVRRLTPVECERLQGFPDGYTAIPWRGKPASECPDGPRYKALGNSWAVPVVRWIGHRIAHEVALSAR